MCIRDRYERAYSKDCCFFRSKLLNCFPFLWFYISMLLIDITALNRFHSTWLHFITCSTSVGLFFSDLEVKNTDYKKLRQTACERYGSPIFYNFGSSMYIHFFVIAVAYSMAINTLTSINSTCNISLYSNLLLGFIS